MNTDTTKPRLIYFQNKYESALTEFLLNHKQEHVRCLSLFFDVIVISDDCDYQQVCDLHQPNLALFESGVNLLTCRKPRIRNVRYNSDIPKLALLNADAWCETRSGSIAEMEHWGVDAVFSIATTAAEHMTELADRIYVWPNCIDPTLYRDYGQEKLIPVLLSGAAAALYPWRRRIYRLISQHYPTLVCPHRGYLSRSSPGQVLYGEPYARILNAAKLSPACGTIGGEVVRKHFEIPACNTCLVTEETFHVKEAGFVDMVNCVFADWHNLLDKLEVLFRDENVLRNITAEGHRLVHSRHTMQRRSQILQWYRLNQSIGAHQRIVQRNPFEPLEIIEDRQNPSLPPLLPPTRHLQAVREGNEYLLARNIDAARASYSLALSYMHRLSEARFKMALCDLHCGNALKANTQLFESIQYSLDEYKAPEPDPVEWAYYMISLLCMGEVRTAGRYADEFPELRHPELDRVRTVLYVLDPRGFRIDHSDQHAQRASIHDCGHPTDKEWLESVCSMLYACGQNATVEKLAPCLESLERFSIAQKASPTASSRVGRSNRNESKKATLPQSTVGRSVKLKSHLLRYRIDRKITKFQKEFGLDARFPWKRSQRKAMPAADHNAVLSSIADIARDRAVNSVLILGDLLYEKGCEAVRGGTSGGVASPVICHVNESALFLSSADKRDPVVAIHKAKRAQGFEAFDLVVAAWVGDVTSHGIDATIMNELKRANCVVVVDYGRPSLTQVVHELIHRHEYVVFDREHMDEAYVVLVRPTADKLS